MRGELFSIGGLIRRWRGWRPGPAPWICAALGLSLAAVWDLLRQGGPVDFILLGLAGYELVIGLTNAHDRTAGG